MPLPKPIEEEIDDAFLARCMSDEIMTNEYPNEEQRYAVCVRQLEERQYPTNIDFNYFYLKNERE